MTGDEPSATPSKKPTFTPKAIIHQKFGSEACYTIEEVKESSANECPGLAIPQKTPCLFRCRLELPDFCVVSKACRRKKEAEQLAAELALRKLGIDSNTSDAPVLDSAEELISRLKFLFSDEILADLELDPKPYHVIAFEDPVECKNLCYIIQSHLEMLGKDGKAFVVAQPPKRLSGMPKQMGLA